MTDNRGHHRNDESHKEQVKQDLGGACCRSGYTTPSKERRN